MKELGFMSLVLFAFVAYFAFSKTDQEKRVERWRKSQLTKEKIEEQQRISANGIVGETNHSER